MSEIGWPDDIRRVLSHGDVLADHANVNLPNPPGVTSYGPFAIPHYGGVRVLAVPTGGSCTVTCNWSMSGTSVLGAGVDALTFAAAASESQLVTARGHQVTFDLLGSVNGVTVDFWAVGANPLPASGAAAAALGYLHLKADATFIIPDDGAAHTLEWLPSGNPAFYTNDASLWTFTLSGGGNILTLAVNKVGIYLVTYSIVWGTPNNVYGRSSLLYALGGESFSGLVDLVREINEADAHVAHSRAAVLPAGPSSLGTGNSLIRLDLAQTSGGNVKVTGVLHVVRLSTVY